MIIVRCGEAPVPPTLLELPRVKCEAVPTKDDSEQLRNGLAPYTRVVVCGNDAGFASLLSRFLRADALDVEFAYVTDAPSPATRAYGLPTGAAAAKLASSGTARSLPLIRDDTGTVLVGEATITGPSGNPLVGEAYADDARLFTGTVPALTIRPSPDLPGVRATTATPRRFPRRRWLSARAVQLGTDGAVVLRDNIPGRRAIKRTSFYRHIDPWLLVLP